MKYDCVIIGSGVSGLTAALTLAQNGYKVAVVESASHLSPLLRRFKRGSVWCDPGFHYSGGFEESGTLSVIFRYLRFRDRINALPMKSDCYDELYMGDRVIPLACGFEGVKQSLTSHFQDDAHAIDRYLSKIRKIMEKTPFINFDLDFADFSRIPEINKSLFNVLDSLNASKELKNLLGRYGQFLYGSAGDEIPFYIHALVMGTFYKSPHTLERGGDEIADAFRSRFEEEGVTVSCNLAATGLKVDEERNITGVITTNNQLLETKNCIYTAHPQLLEKLLPSHAVRPAYLSRLRDLKNTASLFTLYLALDEIPEKLHHTNIYRLSDGSDGDLTSSLALMACSQGQSGNMKKGLCILRYSNSSQLENITYGEKKRTVQYNEYKEKLTRNTLKELLAFYPELEGKFKVVAGATPFTFERYTGTPGGSAYGIRQSINQKTPGPVTSIRGLYLAGQSILMPGVMGATISGLIAVSNITGMEFLWNEVKKCR